MDYVQVFTGKMLRGVIGRSSGSKKMNSENCGEGIGRKDESRKSFKEKMEEKRRQKIEKLAALEAEKQELKNKNTEKEQTEGLSMLSQDNKEVSKLEDEGSERRESERCLDSPDSQNASRDKRGRLKEKNKEKEEKKEKHAKSKEKKEKGGRDTNGKKTKSNFLNPKAAIGGLFAKLRSPSPRPGKKTDKSKDKKDSFSPDSAKEHVDLPSSSEPSELQDEACLPVLTSPEAGDKAETESRTSGPTVDLSPTGKVSDTKALFSGQGCLSPYDSSGISNNGILPDATISKGTVANLTKQLTDKAKEDSEPLKYSEKSYLHDHNRDSVEKITSTSDQPGTQTTSTFQSTNVSDAIQVQNKSFLYDEIGGEFGQNIRKLAQMYESMISSSSTTTTSSSKEVTVSSNNKTENGTHSTSSCVSSTVKTSVSKTTHVSKSITKQHSVSSISSSSKLKMFGDEDPIYDNVSDTSGKFKPRDSFPRASFESFDNDPIYQESSKNRIFTFMNPDYQSYSFRRSGMRSHYQNVTVQRGSEVSTKEEGMYENFEFKKSSNDNPERPPSDDMSTTTSDSGRPRSSDSMYTDEDEWFEWSDFDDSDIEEGYGEGEADSLLTLEDKPKAFAIEDVIKPEDSVSEVSEPETEKTPSDVKPPIAPKPFKPNGNLTVSKSLEGSEKRDRIHNIANELYTTEQEYVNRLSILYQVFIRVGSILPEGVDKQMFPGIEVMYKLHHGNLLPELRKRLQNWEATKKIGDIMKALAPFLKLYTDYVKNYEKAAALLDTWLARSSDFSKLIKDVQDNAGKCKLPMKSYMLEPVQRVPRYELLLKDYVKRLGKDSADREDAEKALSLVTQVAQHFESTMKYFSRMNNLIALQRQLDGPVNIVSSTREIFKEGKILKVHATSGKVVDRHAFLFTDLFLLCNDMRLAVTGVIQRYKVKVVMEVDGMQVTDGDNLDIPNTFYVKTKQKALELCTSTEEEKITWMEALHHAVGERTRARLNKTNPGSRRLKTDKESQELGKQAPIWIHNSDVTMCMLCATPFSALKKKHHCRACGIVICGKCSSRTAVLEYDPVKPLRVCDECFLVVDARLTATERPTSNAAKLKDKCRVSGYMHLSLDGGRTWRKRWFTIHEGIMYSFKAYQDIKPTSCLSLQGCTFTVVQGTNAQNKAETVIKLSNENKTYLFREDNIGKVSKWTEAFSEAAKDGSKEHEESKLIETDV